MPQLTKIEWTDFSSNPLKFRLHETGRQMNMCTKISPGCANCYAANITERWFPREHRVTFDGYVPAMLEKGSFVVDVAECKKIINSRMIGGHRIFVCDMTDLYHEAVSDVIIDQLNAVFACREDVTFQALTKRSERMAKYWANPQRHHAIARQIRIMFDDDSFHRPMRGNRQTAAAVCEGLEEGFRTPCQNIWHGVSIENQKYADQRTPQLMKSNVGMRFLSCEPLLGRILLPDRIWCRHHNRFEPKLIMDETSPCFRWQANATDMIDWVIIGCESMGARVGRLFDKPCNERDWWEGAKEIVRQCRNADVPVFVKQIPYDGKVLHRKGKQWPDAWPKELRIQDFPMIKREAA